VSAKNRQTIASLLPVAATYCFVSLLILWLAVQGVEHAKADWTGRALTP